MPAFRKRESTDSSLSTDNRSDNRSTVREPETWLGATSNQAIFFMTLMKLVFSIYDFKQLMTTATVTMKDGTKAVFSPEHALEHAKGENMGSARKPNTRRREDIATRLLTNSAPGTTPSPAAQHGGHPTPTVPTVQTSASSKPPTLLESQLGELAHGYKIAPEIIEMKDDDILTFIIGYIGADRLKELWMKKAEQNGGGGRGFVIAFVADMDKRGVSFTAGETVEVQMQQIIDAGLPDVSFTGFLEMTAAYDELNQVCTHPKTDAEVAYKYKRVISALDPKIENQMLMRISILENEVRGRGEKPEDDPITLVTEAAGIVLEEESNLEILKALKSGHALNAQGRFDPLRNTRNEGTPPGGQTWSTDGSGPTKHNSTMRDCMFCDTKYTNTPAHKRQHVDLECPNATKAEKDALRTERIQKSKAKRDAWKARKAAKAEGASAGGAKVAQGGNAVDDVDAAAADRIFANGNNGDALLMELSSIIDDQTGSSSARDGRSLMASTSLPLGRLARTHTDAPSVTDVTSVSTMLSPDARAPSSSAGAANTSTPAVDDSHVFVLKPCGDEAFDAVSSGIHCGRWKQEVLPGIVFALEQEKLSVDRKLIKGRTVKFDTFEEAVNKCEAIGIAPIYMGPSPYTDDASSERLNVGDDVSEFLDGDPSSDESSNSDSDVSMPDSDHDAATTTSTRPESAQRLCKCEKGCFNPIFASDRDGLCDYCIAGYDCQCSNDRSGPDGQLCCPTDEAGERLGNLVAEIESYTVNTHVDILRASISRNNLCFNNVPISPGTGGHRRRTKFSILQEMRMAVGAPLLPDDSWKQRRARPNVPMGTPVSQADATGGRRLDFEAQAAAPAQRTAVGTVCSLPVLVVVVAQMLMLFLALHANGASPPCLMLAPPWVCGSLGYINSTTLALPDATRLGAAPTTAQHDDLFDIAREPGALTCAEVVPWPDSESSGRWGSLPMALPGLVCIALLLCTLETTFLFLRRAYADRYLRLQAERLASGLGRPQGPPRDTSTSAPRFDLPTGSAIGAEERRHARRRVARRTPSVASASRFLSTVGEAPLWLSMVFLVHELAARVIPFLFIISMGTLLAGILRAALRVADVASSSSIVAPARVVVRIMLNLTFIVVYLGYGVVVDTFAPATPRWPPPIGTSAVTSNSNTLGAIDILLRSVRALVFNTRCILRRCGGVAIEKFLTRAPTPTDPNVVDYSDGASRSRRRPRALHALNGRAGRALRTSPPVLPPAKGGIRAICWAVIDSGCSWHCHPRADDLINQRPCNDTMSGIDGKPQRVKCIGDLPAFVRDSTGFWRRILIRNVRCVPSFTDTLISVDQFWEESKVNCVFNDVRCIHVPGGGDQASMDLPFSRKDNLYRWAIVPVNHDSRLRHPSAGKYGERALKATIHRPKSTSFFNALPPNEQLDMLHRRLHVGYNLIRRLADSASDVPASIKKGMAHDCEACKAANATHVPHPGKGYQPSHVGRLIDGDMAGPFQRSHHGFRYFLVLVDDHSRFKQVYFLKSKSEALQRVRSFVAKLNAISSIGKPEPVRVVGQLHMDNAGEFLSGEFNEFLDTELITRTTCPPHVHQLNGVAERAIRSVMEVVRSTREASRCPVTFWPHLVEHAVDVLNRTTGPPHDGAAYTSSHQLVTGDVPKILTILPVGCRAYAVKPVGSYVKSNFESRAWSGINLGRCSNIPNAYNIWLPE